MLLEINKKPYHICPNEYNLKLHPINNYLTILSDLGYNERIIGLLNELSEIIPNCVINRPTHGGFIPINLNYNKIILRNIEEKHLINIKENIAKSGKLNINIDNNIDNNQSLVYYSEYDSEIIDLNAIYVIPINFELIKNKDYKTYKLTNSQLLVYIPLLYLDKFKEKMWYYIKEDQYLDYDNLIHLCMIVRNSGNIIKEILNNSLEWIDEWTIVDTGSTDNTKEIIREVLKNKKGKLYERPFIDFKHNRNECLELAGNKCKYKITLDDSYLIKGNIREFLNEVRGDQLADSYSLFIKSGDMMYVSNRVIKSDRNLKYLFRVHEVIQDNNNKNVIIPKDYAYIDDIRLDYLQKRTIERKQWDLEMLFLEIKDNPMISRHYYYVGQTYNLLDKPDLAYEYFMKRVNHSDEGFYQEKMDALFEATRLAEFKLNKPWSECLNNYLKYYEHDKTRSDAYYYIGVHYLLNSTDKNDKLAFKYLKDGFNLGYPNEAQYSVRQTIYNYYIPGCLAPLCFNENDYKLGLNVCKRFLENYKLYEKEIMDHNPQIKYEEMLGWYLIYEKLCLLPTIKINKLINIPKEKPILCLLADGGYDNWTGSDIEKNGMGGSETFIIEIAQYLVEKYDVCVFCKCNNEETYKNVKYIPIIQYASFITENYIESCIISRFSEYLPLSYKGLIENIYFIMHDLGPSINIIIDNYKLKRIFCLTEWHVEYFLAMYPIFKGKTSAFSYGINETFIVNKDVIKRPLSFIYSSFPNRGLLPLLKMWKRIIDKYPLATLNIYCDLDQKWVNNVCPDTIKEIKELLNDATTTTNVINHGWVDKSILASAWKESEYWLYPCTFLETFCLTALESASSRTLAITAKLGALINTVDDRGLMIEGDPNTIEWQNNCLSQLFEIIENPDKKKELLDKNWLNSKEQTWGKRAKDLLMNYLDKNVLEYKFMGNWTSDIPSGTKKDFENILDLFNKSHLFMSINILEIGTYTGTSLIHIAEKIKNLNNIYAIDLWENYKEIDIYSDLTSYITELEVENSFYKNMIKFGYNPIVYKGKSTDMLFQLIKENKMMDLIYVDASHNEYDFMYDVLLSWKILNRGGYLILDDVMSNIKLVDGLNYFIKENKVKILWSNYRVFLEKI